MDPVVAAYEMQTIIDRSRSDENSRAAQRALSTIDTQLMPLTEALTLMPGVQSGKARRYLRGLCDDLLRKAVELYETDHVAVVEPVPGVVMTPATLEDIFGDRSGRQRVTPRGALLLLALYERGALPCRGAPGQPNEKLCAYAASEEALIAMANEEQAAREARRQQRAALVNDPSLVTEAEFEYGLLNEIFFERFGGFVGSKVMPIGGIEVTKSVAIYRSNSGRSQDSAVSFTWVGSDGQHRELDKSSRYAGNRRNDEERNWGLPD